MTCQTCKFFKENDKIGHGGDCEIRLPSWLTQHSDVTTFTSRFVRVDDVCDLHDAQKETT